MPNRLFDRSVTDFEALTNDSEAEGIAIIPEDDIKEIEVTSNLFPILPLRNTVLFPGVVLPITVGRQKSMTLIREVQQHDGMIGAVAQRNVTIEDPSADDMFTCGTLARILKILEMPDGSITVIIQGKQCFAIDRFVQTEPYHTAEGHLLPLPVIDKNDEELQAMISSIKDVALKMLNMADHPVPEAVLVIKNIEGNTFLINYIASSSPLKIEERQHLLEITDPRALCETLLNDLIKELQVMELKKDIQQKVKSDLDQQQREYLLQQQMKTIQAELGDNPVDQEVQEMEQRSAQKKWTAAVAELFKKELRKLQRIHPASGEYATQANYVHTLIDLPWNEYTTDCFDLDHAQQILDEDHFGLEKVKERIVEHLAVLQLKGDMKSPILCLVGPPGVGKTSLGKSIARALGRKYIRVSLGGMHDESEIRGHRKTYIGAMPGRIIQNIKKVQSSNPVFVLDEIDKVGFSAQGDPASALLEVLDPEQNTTFCDNYLEVEYDLSKVLFIATANTLSTIAPALRDRMEIIQVDGYITEEKISIAQRHLIPNLLAEHGIQQPLDFPEETLRFLIENYTRESGVRELSKKLASVMRWYATRIVKQEPFDTTVSTGQIQMILHAPKYIREDYQGNDYAGVVTGLAWTQAGGEILLIETSLSRGNGTLTLTGNLGDVMKESAMIALAYLKAHANDLQINPEWFSSWNVHVHVPEGAIPKDGPSAGITMVTSMASAWTQRKVRERTAMTGEMTLRGRVLPIGGVKEKILAAKRAGINHIILPADNKADIEEIPSFYLEGLSFTYVEDIRDVLQAVLTDETVSKPQHFDIPSSETGKQA